MHRFIRGRKYNNKKTIVDGHTFDSKKEAKRYGQLKLLLASGEIQDLVLQPRFVLQESFADSRIGLRKNGKPRTVPRIVFTADFQYVENGRIVVEDVKSDGTRGETSYRLRMRLFLAKYRDVDFREV